MIFIKNWVNQFVGIESNFAEYSSEIRVRTTVILLQDDKYKYGDLRTLQTGAIHRQPSLPKDSWFVLAFWGCLGSPWISDL